jgi:aminoglycoside phosphotransferase (APT) family kinase protein
LSNNIDINLAREIWEYALETTWAEPPLWIHGDLSASNLLVSKGRLSAVIDFGGLAIGDPACDLAIAWTFLDANSRAVFKQKLPLNEGTWQRGKAWALWKALIVAVGLTDTNVAEKTQVWLTLETILGKTQRYS